MGWVGHTGVVLGHAGVGSDESCRGDGVGHTGVGVEWVMQGWGWSCMVCSGVCKNSLNNLMCHKLSILSFLLTNYFMKQPPHSTPA